MTTPNHIIYGGFISCERNGKQPDHVGVDCSVNSSMLVEVELNSQRTFKLEGERARVVFWHRNISFVIIFSYSLCCLG